MPLNDTDVDGPDVGDPRQERDGSAQDVCQYCGVVQPEQPPRGGTSSRHQCFCVWEDQQNGPLVCVAVGVCCHHQEGVRGIASHHRRNRRFKRLTAPRAADWDEVSSCVTSSRRVPGRDTWHQEGWPEGSPDQARLLSQRHRAEFWPRGPSENYWKDEHRDQMAATADEVAEWLMLARDRALFGSRSMLEGSADVHAAGELIGRLADALASWRQWRAELVVEQSARARRILAAAAFRWGATLFMFRAFVADHLDAEVARRLGEKEIAVLACALHLRRRGRPRKEEDELNRFFKQDAGLSPDEDVPDKIEALQRLAATVGIPRLSPKAVEDQVQPLLARMTEIRREREAAFKALEAQKFDSAEDARAAFEDADVWSWVLEDEAVRTCGTRKKAPASPRPKPSESRAVRNCRRKR